MLAEYLVIGQILKPQGVRGEVKVRPDTDAPERFLELPAVYMADGAQYAPVPVLGARVREGFVYLTLAGCAAREDAEKLRGALLYIDRAHAVALGEDENFICDLEGCAAVDTQGRPIGTLREVLRPGANDVYVFETPRGTLLVPALKRAIPAVDVHARRIVLDETVLPEVAVLED